MFSTFSNICCFCSLENILSCSRSQILTSIFYGFVIFGCVLNLFIAVFILLRILNVNMYFVYNIYYNVLQFTFLYKYACKLCGIYIFRFSIRQSVSALAVSGTLNYKTNSSYLLLVIKLTKTKYLSLCDCEKTNSLGFQPGLTQTRLYSQRSRLEA